MGHRYGPCAGLAVLARWVHTAPKPLSYALEPKWLIKYAEKQTKWALTGIEIKSPDIVQEHPINLSTKHKKYRPNDSNSMAITAHGRWTMYSDSGPITRNWSVRIYLLEIKKINRYPRKATHPGSASIDHHREVHFPDLKRQFWCLHPRQ